MKINLEKGNWFSGFSINYRYKATDIKPTTQFTVGLGWVLLGILIGIAIASL